MFDFNGFSLKIPQMDIFPNTCEGPLKSLVEIFHDAAIKVCFGAIKVPLRSRYLWSRFAFHPGRSFNHSINAIIEIAVNRQITNLLSHCICDSSLNFLL